MDGQEIGEPAVGGGAGQDVVPATRRQVERRVAPAAGRAEPDLLGDLGMHAMDMGVLLDDADLYPDEMLSDVARRLGIGKLFDDTVGLTSA